jgi:hypothetical protein
VFYKEVPALAVSAWPVACPLLPLAPEFYKIRGMQWTFFKNKIFFFDMFLVEHYKWWTLVRGDSRRM